MFVDPRRRMQEGEEEEEFRSMVSVNPFEAFPSLLSPFSLISSPCSESSQEWEAKAPSSEPLFCVQEPLQERR